MIGEPEMPSIALIEEQVRDYRAALEADQIELAFVIRRRLSQRGDAVMSVVALARRVGFAEGIETAAKMHDRQAKIAALSSSPRSRDQLAQHTADAQIIRALKLEAK